MWLLCSESSLVVITVERAYSPRIMSIQMNIGGIDVTVTDPAEAAALLRELGKKPASGAAKSEVVSFTPVNADMAEKTLRFLNVINDADSPLSTKSVMDVLGVKTGNAVGGATKKINNLLADLGYSKHLVYKNPKKPRHPRTWSSGRDIELAIEALEKKIKGQT